MIDYPAALAHFKFTDPVLYAATQTNAPTLPTKAKPHDYAFHLYSSIISQQISVKAADAILSRFLDLVGDPHSPQHILTHNIEDLRGIGLSRQKASYILSIAQHAKDGSVDFDSLDSFTNEQVLDELVKIKGVGQWTAEMFLMFTLCRPDVFSVGDLGLLNAAKKLYSNPNLTKSELLELSQKWSPHRTTAALVLWHSLDNKPKA
ncbi:DNA-3-methyladenine glycosylase 2 family protein [bacterium]|nr:DNA-3-methyladenine glycosylase 2 family protein [bacterium]